MLGCVTGAAGRSEDLVKSQTCLRRQGLMMKPFVYQHACGRQAGWSWVERVQLVDGVLDEIASVQLTPTESN